MKRMILLSLAAVLVISAPASARKKQLTIIHVNDTHSHIDPAREDAKGGDIERAAFVDSVRRADGKRNVLYLHAGDFNQGTSYFTILKGELEASLLRDEKFDCATLGNHEFDNGVEDLGKRVAMTKTPFTCANYDFSSFELGKYIEPYRIIKRGGYRIGIVGMLCNIYAMVDYSISSKIPKIGDDVEIVNKWADYLRNEKKCDLVIILSHLGFEVDRQMAPQTRNVDLIIGGHSHTLLDHMMEEKDLDGKTVRIVQDWCWGIQVGVLKVSD